MLRSWLVRLHVRWWGVLMAEATIRSLKPGMVATVRFDTTHIVTGTFEGLENGTFEMVVDDRRGWWKETSVEAVYREGARTRRTRKNQNSR